MKTKAATTTTTILTLLILILLINNTLSLIQKPISKVINSRLHFTTTELKNGEDVWIVRRKMVRSLLRPQIKYLLKEKDEIVEKGYTKDDIKENKKKETLETTGLVTTFLIIVGAAIARIGGRAAFASILGNHTHYNNHYYNHSHPHTIIIIIHIL